MKPIKLGRSQQPIPLPAVQATVPLVSRRAPGANKAFAVLWIVAAWLIGTLVSELNVTGDEPPLPSLTFMRAETMLQQWTTRETEFAIAHSGINELERVQRDSRLRERIAVMIASASRKAKVPGDVEPAATPRSPAIESPSAHVAAVSRQAESQRRESQPTASPESEPQPSVAPSDEATAPPSPRNAPPRDLVTKSGWRLRTTTEPAPPKSRKPPHNWRGKGFPKVPFPGWSSLLFTASTN